MNSFKMKDLNVQHVLLVLGVVVLGYALLQYTNRKGSEGMNYALNNSANLGNVGEEQQILGNGGAPADMNGNGGEVGSDGAMPLQSNDLMPNGTAAEQGLQGNFLSYGNMIGINTVNSSLRNPNLQLRADPKIPPNPSACAWNMSTIGLEDQTMKEGEMPPNLEAASNGQNL